MRPVRFALFALLAAGATSLAAPTPADALIRAGLEAESRLESARALELFLRAERDSPASGLILRKIARQYSDLAVDLPAIAQKKEAVQHALDYARRAVALEPDNAENHLSLAVCYGKLALHSDTRRNVEYSRLVRESTERALALDPNYAWAHHLLGRWHREVSNLTSTARFFVKLFYGGLPQASMVDATRHLRRAIELEPHQLQHHIELGFVYLATDEPVRARQAFVAGVALPSREKHDEIAKNTARLELAKLAAD